MLLFPAIDLYDHKVVRLLKGDYQKMTVYSEDPVATARGIEADGGRWLHLVDLEGSKDGTTPNFDVVAAICHETKLQVEIGGGIRSLEMIERYLNAGVARVILGTKAVTDEDFLRDAVGRWGERIAVGVDAKDGKVAVKGWIEVLGGGVVNRKVLENCGIDPDEYSGFAFGIGIERIAMLKYGINNIGLMFENNLQFLKQFHE